MDKTKENKLSMFKETVTVLEANNEIFSSKSAMTDKVDGFKNVVRQIEELERYAASVAKGKGRSKKEAKTELVKAVIILKSALISLAGQLNDAELAEKTDITDSALEKMRDTALAQTSQEILSLAKTHLESLQDYEVTELQISGTEDLLKIYEAKLSLPGASISSRKAAHQNLIILFKQGDEILKLHLDNMVKMYRQSHPEFYLTYKNSRKLPQTGIRHPGTKSQDQPSTTSET